MFEPVIHVPDEAVREKVKPIAVWALGGLAVETGDAPPDYLREAMAAAATAPTPERKTAVRQMLKHGKYRASGRGKPASEYLAAAALKGTLSGINDWVDINNTLSLETGLPASIFDMAACGSELLIRHGRPEEAYVFNAAGQTIQLEDLLVACLAGEQGWVPCGNPVKDAMATKVSPDTRDVFALVYAPASIDRAQLETIGARYRALLATHCRPAESGFSVFPDDSN